MFNNEGTYFMKIKLFALLMASFLAGSCAGPQDTVGTDATFYDNTFEKSLHMTQSIVLVHAL